MFVYIPEVGLNWGRSRELVILPPRQTLQELSLKFANLGDGLHSSWFEYLLGYRHDIIDALHILNFSPYWHLCMFYFSFKT
jgi:hypothetical protein